LLNQIFAISSKTEVGSAGEQPRCSSFTIAAAKSIHHSNH